MDRGQELHIIKRIKAGESDAYRLLVDEYSPRIISFIKGIVASYADAEDIAQEVFVKGFFSLDKYRGDAGFYSWLYRIAYNEAISFLRKKNKKNTVAFVDNLEYDKEDKASFSVMNSIMEYPEEHQRHLDREQMFVDLKKALALLEAREQFLITQFYYKKASVKELSGITGDSEGNVKVKLFRIKKKLAEAMDKKN